MTETNSETTTVAHYEDAGSQGEAQMLWNEEHLCVACGNRNLCKFRPSTEAEGTLLLAVSRCLAFDEA